MKSRKHQSIHQPFQNLDELFKKNQIQLAKQPRAPENKGRQTPAPENQTQLFHQAMADVTPLTCNRHWRLPKSHMIFEDSQSDEKSQTVRALEKLIQTGQGFIVAQTAEYMQATGPGIGPEIARQLHRGRYAIQDHLDLHGLTAAEAEKTLHAFIQKALKNGFRGVLIVHGRGLKSPCKPVLKKKVFTWLTRGPLRRHVIALASARSCDGGAGATYVLLRQKPITKRLRKTRTRN